jgi:hypothetical protein
MLKSVQKRWMAFWLCLLMSCTGVVLVHGVLFDLDAFVTFSIFEQGGGPGDELVDGSRVYIMGSVDNVNDGMQTWYGPSGTNLIANSTLGDDVLLGEVAIGFNATNAGTFFTTLKYDPTEVSYVYIRYFDTTNEPIGGIVDWGTSLVYSLVPTLGVARVDFAPSGSLQAENTNNFVIVPEPSTGNLMVLFFAMLGGLRSRMARQKREDELRKQAESDAGPAV